MQDDGRLNGPSQAEPVVSALRASVPDAKPLPPMKAYAVTENDENTGGIIFARYAVAARRVGSQTFGDGDFYGWSCRRAPWADHCAETGKVPAGLCIAHGWHFECHYCSKTIRNEEDCMYRAWDWTFVVGDQHGAVYCDRGCELAAQKQRATEKRLKARVLARYTKRLTARFAGITVLGFDQQYRGSHIYINHRGRVEEFSIRFDWPGQKYGSASFDWRRRERKASIHCCSGDKEAFEAFAAQAIEARSGETERLDPKGESAVRKDAPNA